MSPSNLDDSRDKAHPQYFRFHTNPDCVNQLFKYALPPQSREGIDIALYAEEDMLNMRAHMATFVPDLLLRHGGSLYYGAFHDPNFQPLTPYAPNCVRATETGTGREKWTQWRLSERRKEVQKTWKDKRDTLRWIEKRKIDEALYLKRLREDKDARREAEMQALTLSSEVEDHHYVKDIDKDVRPGKQGRWRVKTRSQTQMEQQKK